MISDGKELQNEAAGDEIKDERNCIFRRVSIRKYKDQPVEDEKIELMLRAAMAAPSAKAQDPWFFYVITNKEKIKELSTATETSQCLEGAPVVFAACYYKDTRRPMYTHVDMAAAVENLLLEAVENGLGGVWIGIAPIEERMETIERMLDIPDDKAAFALVGCGYPAKEPRPQRDRYSTERVEYIR